jgi:hypothetical protein
MHDVLYHGMAAAYDMSDSCTLGIQRSRETATVTWESHFNYGTLLLRKVRVSMAT